MKTIENFLHLVSSYTHPPYNEFCRQFEFTCAVLKSCKIKKFIEYFGEEMTSLSLISCTFETDETLHSILSCPKLRKLQLVNTLDCKTRFQENLCTRVQSLKNLICLELNATTEKNAITENNLKNLLELTPNLSYINIKTSLATLERFSILVHLVPKLNSISISDMDCSESMISFWNKFLDSKIKLQSIEIIGCNVTLEFIKYILSNFSLYLQRLSIVGGTNDILSYVFLNCKQLKLSHLTLPLSAINLGDGHLISSKIPKLKQLVFVSSLKSIFKTECLNLDDMRKEHNINLVKYLEIQSKVKNECLIQSPCFFQAPAYQDIIMDQKEEFSKILTLFPKLTHLKICLKHVSSQYLQMIFSTCLHLQNLTISSDFSTNFFPEGFTGIPLGQCLNLIQAHSKFNSDCLCETFRLSPYIGNLTSNFILYSLYKLCL